MGVTSLMTMTSIILMAIISFVSPVDFTINTKLGTFGEVAYALAPKAVDQILHLAYKVFPESSAAKGAKDGDDKASGEATALAYLMRGVHW